jgi:tripartite-type tricarboxylate transporter receptor subunit TctC
MLTRLITAALTVVVLAPLNPLLAQDWPARTITMIVPFPAGGPLDVAARILAQPMGDLLGQQIIIENIGGAGGSTGSSRVAKATAGLTPTASCSPRSRRTMPSTTSRLSPCSSRTRRCW